MAESWCFSARAFLDEVESLAPQVLEAARTLLEKATDDLGFLRLDPAAFANAPNVSIDYAVLEKTNAAVMLPLDAGWSDVGSWSSLWGMETAMSTEMQSEATPFFLDRTIATCAASDR